MSGECYPGAPKVAKGTNHWVPTPEALERRRWMERRNAAIQGGVWDENEKDWASRDVSFLKKLEGKKKS